MNFTQNFKNLNKINWYPGHMHRGHKLIEQLASKIDLFMEIRDARAPVSTFNKEIDNILKSHSKEKIVLFNKYDLCN